MGKSKAKNKSEAEFLKGEIRRLKKQLDKARRGIPVPDELIVEEEFDDFKPDCPRCGKGFLKIIDLKYILISTCGVCEYNERRKPIDAEKKEGVQPSIKNKNSTKNS